MNLNHSLARRLQYFFCRKKIGENGKHLSQQGVSGTPILHSQRKQKLTAAGVKVLVSTIGTEEILGYF
jgi:hypothetical protein